MQGALGALGGVQHPVEYHSPLLRCEKIPVTAASVQSDGRWSILLRRCGNCLAVPEPVSHGFGVVGCVQFDFEMD